MTTPNPDSQEPKQTDTLIGEMDRAIEISKEIIQYCELEYTKPQTVIERAKWFKRVDDSMCIKQALTLARERIVKIGTFDNETVKKAREIVEEQLKEPVVWDYEEIELFETILSILDTLEREVNTKLLVSISHPHYADTWDYKLTPSEMDEYGITIECGDYKIKITKEPTSD